MNIIFDSMGVQVQVQNETGQRLNTWLASLENAGYTVNYTDYTQPIAGQLQGNSVLITTTHQWYDVTGFTPAIPCGTNFSYSSDDLGGIQCWISNGGSLLLFVNHSVPIGCGPYWPIYDIQLAAALGITTVFAEFDPTAGGTLQMAPNPDAPAAIINGVSTIEAWDSGGIVPVMPNGSGTVLVPLPADSSDSSGLGYDPAAHAFAVLYQFGAGNIIVIGHSGITGDEGTCDPSQGQICAGDNQTFLMNCVGYLAGVTD